MGRPGGEGWWAEVARGPRRGASQAHEDIAQALNFQLYAQLRGGPCKVHKGDTLVVVGEDCAFYPDQVIFCDPRDFGPLLHEIHHPKVVVEVLSRSTADWDRGGKFDHYRELASLREYVVVHTERQVVDLYARQEDGSWLLTRHGPGEAMALASVGVSVSVGALYEAVAGGG